MEKNQSEPKYLPADQWLISPEERDRLLAAGMTETESNDLTTLAESPFGDLTRIEQADPANWSIHMEDGDWAFLPPVAKLNWRRRAAEMSAKIKLTPSVTVAPFLRATPPSTRPQPPTLRGVPPEELEKFRGKTTLVELLGTPRVEQTPRVKTWACGVITTTRKKPTLERVVRSLFDAGWRPSDTCYFRLFAEKDAEIPEAMAKNHPVTRRDEQTYSWPNYHLALTELYQRRPEADAYMLLEDDAFLFCRQNVRTYLEENVLWPATDCALLSLFTSSRWSQLRLGWAPFVPAQSYNWGALAFVFSNQSLKTFLTSEEVINHRQVGTVRDGSHGTHDTDILVADWIKKREYTLWMPTPSLVEHISGGSTVWDGSKESTSRAPRGTPRNCRVFAGDFLRAPGPNPMARQWVSDQYYNRLRAKINAERMLDISDIPRSEIGDPLAEVLAQPMTSEEQRQELRDLIETHAEFLLRSDSERD